LPAPANGAVSSGGAVISADGSRIFALNREAGSLTIIDTTSEAQIGEVAVGPDPKTLAPGPDGRFLYVTVGTLPALAVVDVAQQSVVARIALSFDPYGVVPDPYGDLLYVASSALGIVEVVHVGLGRIIACIPVEPRPRGLAISQDGSRLYATHLLSGRVSVIDTVQRAVVALIPTESDSNMAQKIALHPTNGRAYLPHIRSNTTNRSLLFDMTLFPLVSAIDLAAQQTLAAERVDLSLGPHSVNLPFDLAFAPDGQRLYAVSMGSGDLSVVELGTHRKLADIDVGDGPRAIVLSPDGARAYTVNSLSGDVSVVDLAGSTHSVRGGRRVFVRVRDGDGVTRGATSVAVRTQ
jgi:YVTN family beta-propeller protein